MNVIYASNDNYAKYFAASVISLFENNKDIADINVYLLNDGLSDGSVERINDISKRYGRDIIYIDSSDFMNNFNSEIDTCGFNTIILSRLFVTLYLPKEIKRVIYLDCDTIINGSMAYLDEIDFEGNMACMVPELLMHDEYKEFLGMNKASTYFNSGVIVINLDLWREKCIEKKFASFANENNGRLLFADQDILNKVCEGQIKQISQKYNMSPNLPYFPKNFVRIIQPGYQFDDYKAELKKPIIIHYLGDERPWIKGNHNYYKKYYLKYKEMSPWSDVKMTEGKEFYLFCYHCLNLITVICPQFRVWFSKKIGMKKFKYFGKQ